MPLVIDSSVHLHVKILLSLDALGDVVGGQALADRIGLSLSHVERNLSQLIKDGFVAPKRGPNGGYMLSTPLDAIPLTDLLPGRQDDDCLSQLLRDRLAGLSVADCKRRSS